MPAKKRLTMRQLRTLLRLKHSGAGLSDRTIACQIGVARSTIQEYLARVEAAGLSWPLPDDLTDEALDRLLFPRSGCRPGFRRRVEPDWAMVARELKRPGVTLMTLWEEYRESEPEGYGYSRFCDLFREFERHLSPVMRQHHLAGDKVFVDFSGKRLEWSTRLQGWCGRRRSSSACWGRRVTPTPRRCGPRRQRIARILSKQISRLG